MLILSLLVSAAAAQTSQPAGNLIRRTSPAAAATQASSAQSANNGAGATRVVFSLAAVLGLILLLFWASRRMLPRGAFSAGGTQAIQILARAPLSPRHRVVLLQIGRRIVVVAEGGGGQHVSTLCEITDSDEAAALIGQIRAEQSNSKSFASLLNHATERFRSAEAPRPQADPVANELASTQQELDGLTERVRVMARQFERA
jgi:flagellar biogenesis protein FliO